MLMKFDKTNLFILSNNTLDAAKLSVETVSTY